jgi:ubiquinone/menaquinone biosynthesis C-methylase UbiE
MVNTVDWTSYSNVYDMLLAYNPAYQDILRRFREEIPQWKLTAGSGIADVGAGTGNFSIELARTFPDSTVYHIDLDPGMTRIAEQKKHDNSVENLEVITAPFEDVAFSPGSLEGIVCVHALYTFHRPQQALTRLSEWLSPQGYAFFCDLGRVMVIPDWFRFLTLYLMVS